MAETTTLPINQGTDVLRDTQLVTTGYFTGGVGTLTADKIFTGSLSETNQKYYQNIVNTHPLSSSTATQFSVAYGHVAGSGSYTDSNGIVGASEVIYKQWANLLLPPTEITGGFKISQQGNDGVLSSGTKDDDIYVLVAKRSLFKDRINVGSWTVALSGSYGPKPASATLGGHKYSGSQILHLTDDSKTTSATATPAGNRYNIVSGSAGAVYTASTSVTYGWVYPDVGALVFSQNELSQSIPGINNLASSPSFVTASFANQTEISDVIYTSSAAVKGYISSSGLAANITNEYNPKNAIRFVNCLVPEGAYLKFRSEEEQNSVSYFCRVFSSDMNYTNNPTFVSGSQNLIRHEGMRTDPTVYITGVNLYSGAGHLVATAKLSAPLKKNFGSEATIKVKLTY